MSIYKACDIRGRFGTELLPQHAEALGHALAVLLPPGSLIVVGGDGRLSTPGLRASVASAMAQGGLRVLDLGTVPTPAFNFARHDLGVVPGVMVTASHNPPDDNGFKIVLGEMPLTEEEMGLLRRSMETSARCERTGGSVTATGVLSRYIGSRCSVEPPCRPLRLVVDGGNGVMGAPAVEALQALGHDVTPLFIDIDPGFPGRGPNPGTPGALEPLSQAVRATEADLGIAFDGDGDRAAFVDERGEPLAPDRAIALFVADALASSPGAAIVYDQKCSRLVPDEVLRCGGEPVAERSGYAFIKTTMIRRRAPYAGELSGHHFFYEVGGDDGLVAAARMARLVADRGPLSTMLAHLPTYATGPELRVPVASGRDATDVLDGLAERLCARYQISRADGVRAEAEHGWGLVRMSVTEPVLTARFEGRSEEELRQVQTDFADIWPALRSHL
ncbi:MAG: phosphomannomutase/phosphoglucomutase [Armatimonadetes bacterium]|nr:phosphomannomutase/phosphoglucomutase [Armatimonadota bacterium]